MDQTGNLDGKAAIVTGGGSGIGAAISFRRYDGAPADRDYAAVAVPWPETIGWSRRDLSAWRFLPPA